MTTINGKRTSKYNAIKQSADGYTFDSTMEYKRYLELKLLLSSKEIYGLEVHPVFPFKVSNGVTTKEMFKYIADFCYRRTSDNEYIVEDVKGVKTPVYRLKKPIIEHVYNIKITEITK